MLAPEPYFSACLAVLYHAVTAARVIGWSGEHGGLTAAQSSQVVGLMDAVHNIPHLLQHWEHCDEPLLRAYLESFDARWKNQNGGSLLAVYEDALARRQA